jgi:exodeoxyribonuclease VII large subunit
VLVTSGTDVIIVSRGGGSRTDLATFDHEVIARAIAGSPVPVFTGLGHDIDRSVADEVAHSALTTPTAAAQHVVALVRAWLDRLDEMAVTIAHQGRRGLVSADRRVDGLATACRRASAHGLDRAEARAGHARARVIAAGRAGIRAADTRGRAAAAALIRVAPRVLVASERDVEVVATRVRALDPARALARGWSVTRAGDGRLVRSVADVSVGDTVHTQLADGTLTSTIRDSDDEGRGR